MGLDGDCGGRQEADQELMRYNLGTGIRAAQAESLTSVYQKEAKLNGRTRMNKERIDHLVSTVLTVSGG